MVDVNGTAKRQKRQRSGRDKKRRRGVLDLPKAVEERMAEGRAERESVPLEAHGEWAAPDDRPDPVGILEKQNATRVPELVPIRHGRMIVSPFTFYRGTAAIMACDLSRTPDDRAARAVLRRCAPVELRHVRGAGSPARLRSQRLRRDAAGAVRVGRQAPRGELRRRRARQRPPAQGAASGGARGRRGVPDDDGHGGDDALPGRLVHAVRRRQGARRARPASGTRPRSSPRRRPSPRRRRGRAWARWRSSRSASMAATGSSSSRR